MLPYVFYMDVNTYLCINAILSVNIRVGA